jgi:uncharacterized protein (UPF0262 family)
MSDETPSAPASAPASLGLSRDRLVGITLDDASIARAPQQIEHEREVAIYDMLDGNMFALTDRRDDRSDGPYRLKLGLLEDKLAMAVSLENGEPAVTHMLSLSPFRRIMKDYFLVLDSYYQAIRTATPSRIEAIDMGRRGLHDEGSTLLMERLAGKIEVDFETARRLFTLVAALHWKG